MAYMTGNLADGDKPIDLATVNIEAAGPPFTMAYSFAPITDSGGSYIDHVMQLGWNMAPGGGRVISTEPAWGIQWESKFRQNGANPLGSEWHVRMKDLANTERRPISIFANLDGSGGGITLQGDYYVFLDWDNSQYMNFDFSAANGAINLMNNTSVLASYNNRAVIQQYNAAGTAAIPLPFINSRDEMQIAGPILISGTANATTNALIATSATLAANQSAFNFAVANVVTGSIFGCVLQGNCTEDFASLIQQGNTGANAHAVSIHRILQTSAGDAFSRYEVNGVSYWSAGLDNSDGDKFKISHNATLGTNDRVTIDTATVAFGLPAKLPSFATAGAPSAATAGAGSLIYVTNGDSGSPCLAVSDGTNWRRVALGATISAT